MSVKLLTEHHLEFQSLKRSSTDSSESTLVTMSYCWKSHVAAQSPFSGIVPKTTSTNLLQYAAKMMHGEKTHLYSLCMNRFFHFASANRFSN